MKLIKAVILIALLASTLVLAKDADFENHEI
jgi:hypothetical protein